MTIKHTFLIAGLMLGAPLVPVHAQNMVPTTGALVVVPGFGEVTRPNDQVVANLAVEEQDKDKAVAASRVNQKMVKGIAIVKQQDPQAKLKTQGYYTYAVYPEERPLPNGAMAPPHVRVPTGWRVGQTLEVTTTDLEHLPKTVAAAQAVLTLNGLQFGLSPAASKKLDDERIAATYQNLNERIASIANAMGRKLSDAVIDTIDFEGSGNYTRPESLARPVAMRAMRKTADDAVAEPSFEPGETTLQMQVVGKVKFR